MLVAGFSVPGATRT
ncbi:hypothetical protein A2U01_0068038, partial [Trifolium medium]|nr:hypothetical protein [Trifolium medium]